MTKPERKYTVTALCHMCQKNTVGTLRSDHPYFEGKTTYVDRCHVCMECAPAAKIEREKEAKRLQDLEAEEMLEKTAKALGLSKDEFRAKMKKL